MTVFLAILGILGWVLAGILGFLVVLIVFVLFSPLRVGITWKGERDSDEKIHFLGRLKAFWLCRILGFQIGLEDGEFQGQLRVLWMKKSLLSDSQDDSVEEGKNYKKETSGKDSDVPASQEPEEGKSDSEGSRTQEPEEGKPDSEDSGTQEPEEGKPDSEDSGFMDKRIARIRKGVRSFQHRISKIKTAVGSGKEKISGVHQIGTDRRNQLAFEHVKKELVFLVRHTKVKKCRLELTYSAGAPDLTGISFGIIAVFPWLYEQNWMVSPDFQSEKPYAVGTADFRLKMVPLFLVISFLRIITDRNCRRAKRMIDNLL